MKDITVLIVGLGSALLTVALYFVTKSLTESSILGYLVSMIVPCILFPVVNKLYPPNGEARKHPKDN